VSLDWAKAVVARVEAMARASKCFFMVNSLVRFKLVSLSIKKK
jgi:hypothetical protein